MAAEYGLKVNWKKALRFTSPFNRLFYSLVLHLFPCLLFILLLGGCSNVTLVTYYSNKADWISFNDDYLNCKCAIAGPEYLPNSRLESYEIDASSSSYIDTCLEQMGWKYKLQFLSPSGKSPTDLLSNIYACVRIENPSALPLEEVIRNLVADNSVRNASEKCLQKFGWQMVSESPWLQVDRRTNVLTAPLNSLHKFVEQEKPAINIYRDKSTALTWTMAADLVYSREAAINGINELNSKAYGGFSDWRIPSKTEFEELTSKRSTADIHGIIDQISARKNHLNENCLFWTNTPPSESSGKFFAADLLAKEFSIVGADGPFACKLIAVRGTGWKRPLQIDKCK